MYENITEKELVSFTDEQLRALLLKNLKALDGALKNSKELVSLLAAANARIKELESNSSTMEAELIQLRMDALRPR